MAGTIQAYRQKQDIRWTGVFILAAFLIGAASLIIPVHWLLLAVVAVAIGGYLLMNPRVCYQLVVLTIPFNERIRVISSISFSLNELVLVLCIGVVTLHILFRRQRINVSTRLDGWIALLCGLFILAGFFSESPRGFLGTLKFTEAILMYYITIYFIRTRQLTRATIIRTILFVACSEAAIGILQSLTGSFGANFRSNRGYLGYLGLGSSAVWHGYGTFYDSFNTLGNYLVTTTMLFLPLYYFVMRKKTWGKALGLLLLLGIITTYSRGSLLGLMVGGLFFLWQIQKSQRLAWIILSVLVFIMVPVAIFFANSPYASTLSYYERLQVWQVPLAAITSSVKSLWLGSGLNSYEVVAWPFIPTNVPRDYYNYWFAHNYYLLVILEMGIVGAAIFFSFLLLQWIRTTQAFRRGHGFLGAYNLSLSCTFLSIFFMSIFDHSYSLPYFQIYLFLILGLLYVQPQPAFAKTEDPADL